MKYQQYPKYKNSGIKLIGEIPEGWEVFKMKYLLTSIESGNRESGDKILSGIPSIGGEHVTWNGNLEFNSSHFISKEYFEKRNSGKIQENDLLLVKDGATIGKIAFIYNMQFEKAAVNEHVFILRSNELINSEFLFYYLFSEIGQFQIKRQIRGAAQGGLNSEFPSQCFIVFPQSKEEQQNLVLHIRKKKKNFDELIAKYKTQITLLEEKKQVTINQAVTKGLDPSVKMKDSGIEWIGEIPEHWETKKLKFMTEKINSGITPKGGSITYEDYGIPLLRSQNIHFNGLHLDNVKFINEKTHDKMKNSKIRGQDVLLNITGASIGRCTVVPNDFGEGNVNQHVCIIRCKNLLTPGFLKYFLSSKIMQNLITSSQVGASREGLTFFEISNFFIPVTSQFELNQIEKFLEKQTTQFDELIAKYKTQITLLEEKKQALITAAVTGKIDVTGIVV
jgi:type I restriction enzyme, S subunit